MAYQVLARKWRPQRFSEVVGQEHITRTLQNAILQNRVGHAYLFVGPRGTGKTTTARIFAKALNCAQGIVPEPCCECANCREIAQGSSLDVIEIDGASHNKVEHIRDLRDNVQYTPSRSRFKVYIIDEVHMLTPAAWNALLKTLEEPPPHVKFLFATTEAHKVLPTIMSRCQRFDLKGIPIPLISARLRQIADQESICVDDGALTAIARAADGGMRDAQSVLDQIIAFCGGRNEQERVREADVIEVFGLASSSELRTLAEGLLRNDLNAGIEVIQGLADRGRDLERLYADLVGYVRNLMVCTVCRDPGRILELPAAELAEAAALAASVDPGLVQRLVQGLVAEEWSFRSALNKRLYLEATLARVMLDAHSVQLNDIIAQLLALQNGGQIPTVPAPPARVIPAPAPAPVAASAPASPGPVPVASPPPPAPPRAPVSPPAPLLRQHRDGYPAALAAPAGSSGCGGDAAASSAAESEPDDDVVPHAAESGPADGDATPAAESEPDADIVPPAAEPEPDDDVVPPAVEAEPDDSAVTPAPDPDPAAGLAIAEGPPAARATAPAETTPADLFQALLAKLEAHPAGAGLLPLVKRLHPISIIGDVFQVAYDAEELLADEVRRLQAPETMAVVRECFAVVAPRPESAIVLKRWIASVSDDQRGLRRRATAEERERVASLPFVRTVCAAVGGQVIDVRVPGPEPRRGER